MEDNYQELLLNFGFDEEQVRDLVHTINQDKVNPANCKHVTVNGDLFGASCAKCGKIMQGRGYGGDAKKRHHYVLMPDGKYGCLYCRAELVVG